MGRFIAPSLLAANFADLQHAVELVNESEAGFLHLDIMDGQFVPNISFGMPVMQAVKKISKKPLDVHLMIVKPEQYFEKFKQSGADWLTVHIEECKHLHRALQEIRELGMKAGVALNPHTPVSTLEEIITYADLILIMSVNPGFGGQKFIETSYEKIRKTKNLILSSGSNALIEVDGGVDLKNAGPLFEAGADILVAGTTVFNSPDAYNTIHELKNAGS